MGDDKILHIRSFRFCNDEAYRFLLPEECLYVSFATDAASF